MRVYYEKYLDITVLALYSLSALTIDFKLTSSEMNTGKPISMSQIFEGFGCEGGNKSPSLSCSGAPGGIRRLSMSRVSNLPSRQCIAHLHLFS